MRHKDLSPHLTANSRTVLETRYLLKNEMGTVVESPAELFWRVAKAVADAETRDQQSWAEKFYELMANLRFIPNSPTLMNAGKPKGQLSACFVLPIADSLDSIFDALKLAAKIHQSGGGTGFSFSQLRPQGSRVRSSHGVASGPVSFMRIFDVATETVKQGGTRRGANMAVLRVNHPDILEFIECKLDQKSISNFNISVGVTHEFMAATREGRDFWLVDQNGSNVKKVRAKDVFDRIVQSAWKSGDPGLVFLDRMNFFNPTPQVGEFESTNPCVVGSTRVQVKGRGLIPIQELVGRSPTIATEVDGTCEHTPALKVFCTGVRPVFRLRTFEGYEVTLTSNHLVTTDRGDVAAEELQTGDRVRLVDSIPPKVDRENSESRLGEVVGWLTGDGHFTHHGDGKRVAVLSFYGADKQEAAVRLLESVQLLIQVPTLSLNHVDARDMVYIRSTRLEATLKEVGVTVACKKGVPECVWRSSFDQQAGYLRGLFSADGSVQGTLEKGVSVRLTSIELQLLQDVQQLLLYFGIKSVVYKNRRTEQRRLLPDSSKNLREYNCVACHELVISKGSLHIFDSTIGFIIQEKQEKLQAKLSAYVRGPYRESFFATFEELQYEGEEEVFDLTEPVTSHFYANGLLIHNCGEQPLLPFESCNLGSLNLGLYFQEGQFDWECFRKDIETATRFLDNIIDLNSYPIPECKKITLRNRKIGLGVMGFADLLLMAGLPYSSPQALLLGEQIMSFLDREAKRISAQLARERGPFPNWKGSMWQKLGYQPLRNATVSTVAPTGTISMIAGASSGIEPLFAGVFTRNVLGGKKLLEIHPAIERLLGSRNLEMGALTDEVLAEELGPVWSPTRMVSVDTHVRMQAAFQRHSDSAVSKTINLPEQAAEADIAQAYQLAYDLGCKGITVYRDKSKPTQVLEHSPSKPFRAEDCPVC